MCSIATRAGKILAATMAASIRPAPEIIIEAGNAKTSEMRKAKSSIANPIVITLVTLPFA